MSLVHTNKTLKRLLASKAMRWKDRVFEMIDRAALAAIAGDDVTPRQAAAVYLRRGRRRLADRLRYSRRAWSLIGRHQTTAASNTSAPRSRAPAATPGAIRPTVTLVAVSKTFPRRGDRAGDRRRPARVRRKPRAGGQGQMAAADGEASRHRAASDRPAAIQQGQGGGGAVRRHPFGRSASLCEALAKEIAKQGRTPLLFAEINTGAEPQKAGVLPQDADAFLDRLPRNLRPDHFRPDVHSAARRGAGPAFRAHRQDREAQRPEAVVDGHERGFRRRDFARRHPCARRQRDFRGTQAT